MDVIFYLEWKPHLLSCIHCKSYIIFSILNLVPKEFSFDYTPDLCICPSSWHSVDAQQLLGEWTNDHMIEWRNEKKINCHKAKSLFSSDKMFQVLMCKLFLSGRFYHLWRFKSCVVMNCVLIEFYKILMDKAITFSREKLIK